MRKLIVATIIALSMSACVYSPNVFVDSDVTVQVSK